jgi:2-succinyl-5-enolpyruvyl-6-hydroxy-3-cyclohexene-1-carboxylate synthase
VTLVLGDVSFIHDLNSLYFLESLNHSLKIVLINNQGGGIFTLLPIKSEEDVISYITSPHEHSFKQAAKLVNIDYFTVSDEKELAESFKVLQDKKSHCIMEIMINNDTNLNVYQKLKTIKNE